MSAEGFEGVALFPAKKHHFGMPAVALMSLSPSERRMSDSFSSKPSDSAEKPLFSSLKIKNPRPLYGIAATASFFSFISASNKAELGRQ